MKVSQAVLLKVNVQLRALQGNQEREQEMRMTGLSTRENVSETVDYRMCQRQEKLQEKEKSKRAAVISAGINANRKSQKRKGFKSFTDFENLVVLCNKDNTCAKQLRKSIRKLHVQNRM